MRLRNLTLLRRRRAIGSFRSIQEYSADIAGIRAPVPLYSAVRLCLTRTRSFLELSGGCASNSRRALRPRRSAAVMATMTLASLLLFFFTQPNILAQKKRVPPGGRIAIVVDERLSALRAAPQPSARLLRRVSRGGLVSIRGASRSRDGLLFYHVVVTRRTSGWLQSEAIVATWHIGDDQRLLRLIRGADEFDRAARARIFLDAFPRSSLRPQVLLLYGDAAEEAANRLSREAERRFERREIPSDGAPEFSYYLNYSGLDRYNRQGVIFVFDRETKRFHYEGAAWREILRRHPRSPEADQARERLKH
jgi:hypothetical protein